MLHYSVVRLECAAVDAFRVLWLYCVLRQVSSWGVFLRYITMACAASVSVLVRLDNAFMGRL